MRYYDYGRSYMIIVIGLFNYQKNTFGSLVPSLSWQPLWISVTSIVGLVIGIYQRECQRAVLWYIRQLGCLQLTPLSSL